MAGSGIITPDGRPAGQQAQVVPIQAIIDQFFTNIMNSIMLTTFTRVFAKQEAESLLLSAYQFELSTLRPFFEQVGDPAASGKLKSALEQAFEAFKGQIMNAYKTEETNEPTPGD